MKLIVGLGNPGKEYHNTKHNIGFMFLDYLVDSNNFILNKKFNSMEYETLINGEKILYVKPLSYMNLSGEVVIKYINYYKISLEDLVIIQDDLDLSLGKCKLLFNRGDGGHNGIKNITLHLSSRQYLRLKIGISKSEDVNMKDYVLSKFTKNELDDLANTFKYLNDFVLDFIEMSRDLLIGKYNSRS